jgi:uncharacterized membrane protein YqjE
VAEQAGFIGRLASAADHALSMAQTRLSLFAVEIEEEGVRLGAGLFNLVLAALFLAFGLFALAVFMTLWLWDTHRLLVVGVSALMFLLLAIWTAGNAHRRLRQGRRLFTDSIAELQRDRDALEELK